MSKPMPSRVLILGATSAIAEAVALELAPLGARFYLVARDENKLAAVRGNLLVRGAASAAVRALDLDNTAAHEELLAAAAAELGGIDLALIAYGVLGNQPQAEASFAAAEQIMRTNFLSALSLITWLANFLEQQRSGTLAVIGSVAGDRGRKSNYIYGASKGALHIVLEGVRNRIDRAGVQVLTIKPGFVATPMTAHLKQGVLFSPPARVAQGILKAVRKRKDVAYVPGFWKPILLIIRHVPECIFKKLNL